MICVSIAQKLHQFAMVDVKNASRQCDMIELRLDRLQAAPEIGLLLSVCDRPTLISCRRRQDGGDWSGSESVRLALLRAAILEKPAYIEIETDCADQVPRYGTTMRVIAYANLEEVPENIEEIHANACAQDADVVKLTVPARTPDEAWPLIKILAKGKTPTVVVGWGRCSRMLNILGRRYKAPWTYAALEKGMEAYPGMPTIAELEETYDYARIDSRTPLLAIAGYGEEQALTARVLNHGFRAAGDRTRCLPLEIDDVDLFAKVVRAVKLAGVLVDMPRREQVLRVVTERAESTKATGSCDFVAIDGKTWTAFDLFPGVVVAGMADALRDRDPGNDSLKGRNILVVGCSSMARGVATMFRVEGAVVTIAGRDNERARLLAGAVGGRCIPATQVYSAVADGVVLFGEDVDPQPGRPAIDAPKGIARRGLVAIDLSDYPRRTAFLKEVEVLGGVAVRPTALFAHMIRSILKLRVDEVVSAGEILETMDDDF